MNDRMTVASQGQWRTDAPPVGVKCEVWFYTSIVNAKWDGHSWRNDKSGAIMPDVTHWRPCHG